MGDVLEGYKKKKKKLGVIRFYVTSVNLFAEIGSRSGLLSSISNALKAIGQGKVE